MLPGFLTKKSLKKDKLYCPLEIGSSSDSFEKAVKKIVQTK